MTIRTFQILLALAEGPLHGYGIRQRVAERTDDQVRLGSGTLYEAVHRLLGDGLIEEVTPPTDQSPAGGPPRRYYALTRAGRVELVDELRRMESAVAYARELALLGESG